MRVLHTSDWHLGRSFHREGMLAHQATFVDHLLEVIDAERVDLVVISGDLYDRALPQVDAVRLADEAFARLAASRAKVVAISGNHDSPQRLGFGSRLIDEAGVFLRTDPTRLSDPVLLEDRHGGVAVYAIPYLDPDSVGVPWGLSARSHESALSHAMGRIRADLARRGSGTRSLVLAHAFVAGSTPSDSERDISVGGVARVAASVFQGVDYVALGHLHGQQVLTQRLRYSGSPLAYSFSEAGHIKGSWLVDLDRGGLAATEFVPAPVPRRLAALRGDLASLLSDPTLAGAEECWVQVTLTDPVRPLQPMERIRRRFPHALALAWDEPGGPKTTTPHARVSGRADFDVVMEFVAELRGVPASEAEAKLLRTACDASSEDPDLDRVAPGA